VPPLGVSSFASSFNIHLVQGSLPLLGSVVGLDSSAIHTFLLTKVVHHQEFFEALRSPHLPAQHALLLLRLSAHPRMIFLLRSLPPDLTASACADFDSQIRASAIHILRLSHDRLSQAALDQFCLPLRRGGLGLRSMLSIAPAAFLGSIAASAPLLIHVPRPPSVPPHSIPLLSRLQEAYRVLRLPSKSLRLPDSRQLPSSDSFLDSLSCAPIPKLQRAISHLLDARLLTSIIAAASPDDHLSVKAHFTSLSQPHTSFWLSTLPTCPTFILHNDQFLLATRLRLRLPPSANPPTHCVCGASLHLSLDHFMICRYFRRRAVNLRHDSIALWLHNFLRSEGLESVHEPHLDNGTRQRPDLEVRLDNGSFVFTDITVVIPPLPV